MTVPANAFGTGTPQDENIDSRSARSLGGGATVDIRMATWSLWVAWSSETPGM